eukprot:1160128-Pelagomonas_calceolata.AAC.8
MHAPCSSTRLTQCACQQHFQANGHKQERARAHQCMLGNTHICTRTRAHTRTPSAQHVPALRCGNDDVAPLKQLQISR